VPICNEWVLLHQLKLGKTLRACYPQHNWKR